MQHIFELIFVAVLSLGGGVITQLVIRSREADLELRRARIKVYSVFSQKVVRTLLGRKVVEIEKESVWQKELYGDAWTLDDPQALKDFESTINEAMFLAEPELRRMLEEIHLLTLVLVNKGGLVKLRQEAREPPYNLVDDHELANLFASACELMR